MKTYSSKIANSSIHAEHLEAAKLKLKNADPKALSTFIEQTHARKLKSFQAKLGFKPPVPIMVHALSDLHIEAVYHDKQGNPHKPPMPADPWDSARAFVSLRHNQIDPAAANVRAIKLKSKSFAASSAGLVGAVGCNLGAKSVRFELA